MVDPLMTNAPVEIARIEGFLRSHFDIAATKVDPLYRGETAQAYEIHTDDGSLILRIGPHLHNFQKDRVAAEIFAGPELPVPRVLELGEYVESGKNFALSQRVPGQRFCDLSPEEKTIALPSLMNALIAVHALPLPYGDGFGRWEYNRGPNYDSWQSYLMSEKQPVGKSFAEQELIDKARNMMNDLSAFSPKKPWLLHGDFGNDNLLVENGEVSGVIDWGESRYGDPVYDLAWLEFWDNTIPAFDAYEQQGAEMDKLGSHLSERLLASKCSVALGAIWYFQFSNQKEAESSILERLDGLVS